MRGSVFHSLCIYILLNRVSSGWQISFGKLSLCMCVCVPWEGNNKLSMFFMLFSIQVPFRLQGNRVKLYFITSLLLLSPFSSSCFSDTIHREGSEDTAPNWAAGRAAPVQGAVVHEHLTVSSLFSSLPFFRTQHYGISKCPWKALWTTKVPLFHCCYLFVLVSPGSEY